ncbi:MAG: S4 domain-containing protein [Sediminibacterium sp.]
MAREISVFVHGEEELKKAIATTEKIFSSSSSTNTTTTTKAPITSESFSLEDLEAFEGLLKFEYPMDKIKSGIDVISFLAETGIFTSKGEARKMILNRGVSINRNKVTDMSTILDERILLHQQYVFVQKGKNNYYLVKMS